MVLANKIDLKIKNVSYQEVVEFKTKHKDLIFLECSARTGFHIEDAFNILCLNMIEKSS